MKILTCFIPPTSGDATVCNYDILEQSIEVRKKVGYLPENNPLYLDLYVEEFLSFIYRILNPSSSNSKRIAEIIELTGLQQEKHKKIGALSKGYRQRVGLAQALLHDPEVLILDEPTSGLDPNQLLEIRSLIKTIGKEKTIMLSTHIMQEVEAICDRAIIIHKGRIVADDSTKNLHHITSPGEIVKVEFGSPVDAGLLAKIDGVRKVTALTPVIFQVSSVNSVDIRPGIFKFAVDQKLTVLTMQKEELGLEEVFQELTRG
jgi:ABC-2 type transport system ATP-binding protein